MVPIHLIVLTCLSVLMLLYFASREGTVSSYQPTTFSLFINPFYLLHLFFYYLFNSS